MNERFAIIIVPVYLDFPCLFLCEKIPIFNFYVFICFHQWTRYKTWNLWCHVTCRTRSYNTIVQLPDISKIASTNFCIEINTCHRRVYLLWFFLYSCPMFCLFFQSIHTNFRLFSPVNFIFRIYLFQEIYELVILQSTSEARIWI